MRASDANLQGLLLTAASVHSLRVPRLTSGRLPAFSRDHQLAGFAQLIVLAGLAVVAGIITLVSAATLKSTGTTIQVSSGISDEVAASSAIARALAGIRVHEAGPDQTLLAGRKVQNAGATKVRLSLKSAGGALNPIGAAPALIDTYLDRLEMPPADRSALTGDLATARRGADEGRTETTLYRYVLSFASGDDITSDFSAYNPTSGVDPHFASERVLSALPDLTTANVQQLLDERKRGAEPLTIQSAYFVSAIPRFTLMAQVEHDDGSRYVERVPIEISSAGSVIYLGREP